MFMVIVIVIVTVMVMVMFDERVDKFIVQSKILPINCRILKLFPRGVATDQTTPRRSFPVWSQGISFYSSVTLAQTTEYFLSLCSTSRLQLREKAIHFSAKLFFYRTASSGFAFAFGTLYYVGNLRISEDWPKYHPCWLEELDLHHFHFSGKALQTTIIPSQSDIT